ncbi:hypothetical protein BBP40_006313 [Aspergillus hancockii]|nr:hypothetical protein BBP40_006313 [Aspergillus hancockii]
MSQADSSMVEPEEGAAPIQSLNAPMAPTLSMAAKGPKTKSSKKAKPVPRQDSPQAKDPRNFTTPHLDQQDWSWTNLPDILYQLFPSASEKKDRKSETLLMRYPIHGKYLHDIPILPDNISSTVEEFRVEAWMRLDRRIRLKDITDRMHPDFRIQGNALQQRGVRFRQQFSMVAWDSGNKRSQNLKDKVITKIKANGIDPSENSTRGITPGLINPALGEAGGRIPLPDQFNKEKRAARGRKPLKRFAQTGASTAESIYEEQSAELPVELSNPPQEKLIAAEQMSTSAEFDTTEDIFTYVPTFVPFDESNDKLDGPLPVIRGVIPDEELPETLTMEDVDLTLGINSPAPRRNTEKALKLISPNRIQHKRPSPLKLFRDNLCSNSCHIWGVPAPVVTHHSIVSVSDCMEDDPSELLPPSHGLYPNTWSPCSEADLPLEIRAEVFDNLFEQCISGARYLFDIPMISPACEMTSIEDIKIEDYF